RSPQGARRARAGVFAGRPALLLRWSGEEAGSGHWRGPPGRAVFWAGPPPPPQTIGLILGRLAADEAELLTLGVHEGHRRHGIARRLVAALMQAAKGGGARRLFLEVGHNNAAAVALYPGVGFCQVGTWHRYYQHGPRRDDALVLALGL